MRRPLRLLKRENLLESLEKLSFGLILIVCIVFSVMSCSLACWGGGGGGGGKKPGEVDDPYSLNSTYLQINETIPVPEIDETFVANLTGITDPVEKLIKTAWHGWEPDGKTKEDWKKWYEEYEACKKKHGVSDSTKKKKKKKGEVETPVPEDCTKYGFASGGQGPGGGPGGGGPGGWGGPGGGGPGGHGPGGWGGPGGGGPGGYGPGGWGGPGGGGPGGYGPGGWGRPGGGGPGGGGGSGGPGGSDYYYEDRGPGSGWPSSPEWQGLGVGSGGAPIPPWAWRPINVGKLPLCYLSPVKGKCNAQNLTRWGYNPYKNECQSYEYGGCGGTRNRFTTKEICEKQCMKPIPPSCSADSGIIETNLNLPDE